jgi:hypothetical protein
MGDLEVFIKCDSCTARSREIWTRGTGMDDTLILSFCGHHADKFAVSMQAQGFNPLESEVLTK